MDRQSRFSRPIGKRTFLLNARVMASMAEANVGIQAARLNARLELICRRPPAR